MCGCVYSSLGWINSQEPYSHCGILLILLIRQVIWERPDDCVCVPMCPVSSLQGFSPETQVPCAELQYRVQGWGLPLTWEATHPCTHKQTDTHTERDTETGRARETEGEDKMKRGKNYKLVSDVKREVTPMSQIGFIYIDIYWGPWRVKIVQEVMRWTSGCGSTLKEELSELGIHIGSPEEQKQEHRLCGK